MRYSLPIVMAGRATAMSSETVRTHIVVPKDLVASIDELVGRRGRRKSLTEAAKKELARIRLARAAWEAMGSLEDVDIPGWETSESAAEWVRASREVDQARLERIWKEE
jgi:hypothetical protein